MKVWIINQYANPPSRAGGTRHFSLARELQKLGHEVEVIAWNRTYLTGTIEQRETNEYCICDGVPFTFISTDRVKILANRAGRICDMLAYARALLWYIRSRTDTPDVIFGSTPTLFTALVTCLEAQKRKIPFILEVRDIWPQTLIDLGGYSKFNLGVLLLGVIERFLYRKADHIVSLLPYAHEHIVKRGGTKDRVTWIPNGIDLELQNGGDRSISNTKDKKNGVFVVKYAGAHGLANALDSILDTAKILHERHTGQFLFEMIGQGHDKERLMQRVKAERIENVFFNDPVPKAEIYSNLTDANALIVNMNAGELYRFGISFNKLYDYMAVARPIIFGSASANNPIHDAGAGISVPANNAEAMAHALEELAAMTPFERNAMGDRGRAYVEQYHDMKKLASQLDSVITAVVEKNTSQAAVSQSLHDQTPS